MISRLQIQNFKCFQESQPFEFSKLNLLTGINGRGKSSLIQSLLLVSQSIDKWKRIEKLSINGKHINLGNYEDIKNSLTPRSENIVFNIDVYKTFNASLSFNEDENDELAAIAQSIDVTLVEKDEIEHFDLAISEFVQKLDPQLAETHAENFPVNINNIAFNYFFSRIHYVSADRLGPVKYVDKTNLDDSDFIAVGSRGEYAINVLAKNNLPLVNDKLYLGLDAKSVIQQTEEWLSYILEGAKIKVEGRDKASSVLWLLINNRSNSYNYKPTNVGFGYSYILPLIISGLIAQPGEVLIVENPEAHLHPRAQSRIAEFFARVASCGIQVFIESHSEHILNGFRLSILNPQIEINNEDVTVHYFNEGFTSEKLEIDSNGKILNWPSGFFDQQEIDLANIFKYARQIP